MWFWSLANFAGASKEAWVQAEWGVEDLDIQSLALWSQSHTWAGIRDPVQISKSPQPQEDCDYKATKYSLECLIVNIKLNCGIIKRKNKGTFQSHQQNPNIWSLTAVWVGISTHEQVRQFHPALEKCPTSSQKENKAQRGCDFFFPFMQSRDKRNCILQGVVHPASKGGTTSSCLGLSPTVWLFSGAVSTASLWANASIFHEHATLVLQTEPSLEATTVRCWAARRTQKEHKTYTLMTLSRGPHCTRSSGPKTELPLNSLAKSGLRFQIV